MKLENILNNLFSKKRYLIIVFFILSAAILTIAYYFYNYSYEEIREDKESDLKAIAELKTNQIQRWLFERSADAEVLLGSPGFVENLKTWIADISNNNLKETLIERCQIIADAYRYESIIITDVTGHTLLSGNSNHNNDHESLIKVIQDSPKTQIYSTLYYCDDHSDIHYDFIIPFTKNNQQIANIVFRVDPKTYLYPLIEEWPTDSPSAENLIIKEEGDNVLFLNNLRHKQNTALKFSLPLTRTDLPAAQAFLGKTGITVGNDYRNVEVLAYISRVPDTDWYMISKIDMSEVLSYARERGIIILIIITAVIFSLIGALAFFYSYRQKNIYKSLYKAEQEYKTTLYSIGDAVITTDSDGIIKNFNPPAELLTGWNEDEAINLPLNKVFNIINEETREIVKNPVNVVLEKGLVVGLANHTILISKNGEETPISDSAAPIKDNKGNITGVVLVFRDQSEERLHKKILNFRINLYNDAPYKRINELLTRTIDKACEFTNSEIGFFHLLEEDQETLSMQAWSTKTEREYCDLKENPLHHNISEAGVWADAVRDKKPVIHNDYNSLNNKKDFDEGHPNLDREMIVPVIRNGNVVAILGVGNKMSDYNQRDIATVEDLANAAWKVTESKKAAELIKESNRRLYDTINNLAGVVYRCQNDKNWTMEYISEAVNELTGYNASDFIDNKVRSFNSIIHPDDQDFVRQSIQEALNMRSKYNLEYRIITSSGKIKWVWEQGQGIFDNDILLALEGYIEDISFRKEHEHELEKSDRIFNLSIDMLCIAGFDGYFKTLNPAWTRVLGYSTEELLAKPWLEFVHPDDREATEKIRLTLVNGQRIFHFENRYICKDGSVKWLAWNSFPYLKEKIFYAVARDVTERKKMIDEIVDAKEKAEASEKLKTEFLAQMSHEIRTPINVLIGNASLLQEFNTEEFNRENADIYESIDLAGRRIIRTIDLILNASELQTGIYEPLLSKIDLVESLGEIFKEHKTFAESKGLKLNFNKGIEHYYGLFDNYSLKQIFANILDNAIKFTDKGSVTIDLKESNQGDCIVQISDTGIGMSAEFIENIFEPFSQEDKGYSRTYDGTGLGLSNVKQYCRINNAKIEISSEKNVGSTFSIIFSKYGDLA